jgi:hypothetical protein
MRFKGTFILLIVCLALGVFLYFYEIKGGEKREKAKEAEGKLWKLEDKEIRQIEFVYPEQRITAVRRSENEWFLTEPRPLAADSEELNRLAGSVAEIKRESVVEQNAADLEKYGLSPPQSTLELGAKDGKEYALAFGDSNPTGNSVYAMLPGQKEVFLVRNSAAAAFSKSLEDLRDHSVLSFERQKVQSISLRNPKGDFALIKDEDDRWWIDGAEKIAADSPGVRGILNALSMAKIPEFFDHNPEEYAGSGLKKSFIDVRLTYGEDKAIKHLVIGAEKSKIRRKSDGKKLRGNGQAGGDAAETSLPEIYLAKDESRQDLFFVEKDLVDKLHQSLNDMRDRALAPFQRWVVDFIILKNSQGDFNFTKSGGEWFFSQGKEKARWETINGIFDALEKPVKAWIDDPSPLTAYGLDKPVARVILKQGSRAIVDCSLGKGKGNTVYGRVKGDPSIKEADPESLELLEKGEPDFREAQAADTPEN